MSSLAQRLKEARIERGLTQAQLADSVGLSQGQIGNLESGSRDSTTSIAEIADVLKVRALWLATGKGPKGLNPKAYASDVMSVAEMMQDMSNEDRHTILTMATFLKEKQAKQKSLIDSGAVSYDIVPLIATPLLSYAALEPTGLQHTLHDSVSKNIKHKTKLRGA